MRKILLPYHILILILFFSQGCGIFKRGAWDPLPRRTPVKVTQHPLKRQRAIRQAVPVLALLR